jgi:hypothetical protein
VSRIRRWQRYFEDCKAAARVSQPFTVSGRLTRVAGLVMEAVGLKLAVGNGCFVLTPSGQRVDAEVVGFSGDRLFLMPSTDIYGLKPGALVIPVDPAITRVPRLGEDYVPRRRAEDRAKQVPIGAALLGRVVDGFGRALDSRGPLLLDRFAPLHSRSFNPLEREPIRKVLDVGVRAINSLLTVGARPASWLVRGQRRRQKRFARHDGALHRGRCGGGRADRRARARGARIRGEHPDRRRRSRARWWSQRRPTRRRCCAFTARLMPPRWRSTFAIRAVMCC